MLAKGFTPWPLSYQSKLVVESFNFFWSILNQNFEYQIDNLLKNNIHHWTIMLLICNKTASGPVQLQLPYVII